MKRVLLYIISHQRALEPHLCLMVVLEEGVLVLDYNVTKFSVEIIKSLSYQLFTCHRF